MRTPPNQVHAFNIPLPITKDNTMEKSFNALLEKYTLNSEPEWKTEQKNSLEQLS